MSDRDIKELKKELGNDVPKANWLEEVKRDAKYNVLKRIREQREKEALQKARTTGNIDKVLNDQLQDIKKGK